MKREIEGYGPGETSIGDKFRILELPLFTYKLDTIKNEPLNLPSSTKGSVIKCHYYLEFITDVE